VEVFISRYDCIMVKKSLIETNPYLRDPVQRRKALLRSVASSTAIETGGKVETVMRMLSNARKRRRAKARRA